MIIILTLLFIISLIIHFSQVTCINKNCKQKNKSDFKWNMLKKRREWGFSSETYDYKAYYIHKECNIGDFKKDPTEINGILIYREL